MRIRTFEARGNSSRRRTQSTARRELLRYGAAILLLFPYGAAADAPGTPAEATRTEQRKLQGEAGLGVASVAASLVYSPAKLLFAGGGGVVAGMAYLYTGGDGETARKILESAMRGDYLITPEHLTGERGVEFLGRTTEQGGGLIDVAATNPAAFPVEELPDVAAQDVVDFAPWQRPERIRDDSRADRLGPAWMIER